MPALFKQKTTEGFPRLFNISRKNAGTRKPWGQKEEFFFPVNRGSPTEHSGKKNGALELESVTDN